MTKYQMIIITKSVVELNDQINGVIDSNDQDECAKVIGDIEASAVLAHEDILDVISVDSTTTMSVETIPLPDVRINAN